jgi:hypothetical protein
MCLGFNFERRMLSNAGSRHTLSTVASVSPSNFATS